MCCRHFDIQHTVYSLAKTYTEKYKVVQTRIIQYTFTGQINVVLLETQTTFQK